MELGEFSDVSLDSCECDNFRSCDETESSSVLHPSRSSSLGESSANLSFESYNDDSGFLHHDLNQIKSSKGSGIKTSVTQIVNKCDRSDADTHTDTDSCTPSKQDVDNINNVFTPSLQHKVPTCLSTELKRNNEPDLESQSLIATQLTETTNNESENSTHSNPPSGYEPGCESDSTSQSLDTVSTPSTPRSNNKHYSLEKQSSRMSFDELLFELYDRHGYRTPRNSISIDGSSTDYSSLTECHNHKSSSESTTIYSVTDLQEKDVKDLQQMVSELSNKIIQKNTQLVKCLRNRERLRNKENKHFDMITAVIQAWSSKTSRDAKMKFSLEPTPGGEGSFDQWKAAIASVTRGPTGLPGHFRYRIWLSMANDYIKSLQLDWDKVLQFAFNDKCNPDDDALGIQIVKDLHRTGCSSFSGIENEEDRVILQRVLLGYARWNKVTGYCQGFNILAALILDVTNKNEADALKIMIYLVDKVLPKEYFAHSLRALTVDMAVFRNYLSMKLPKLSAHLMRLQEDGKDMITGKNVEPPLTNVFTMQWFLTLFATSLPLDTVLKVWDCVMIDGSEILIRTALVLWTKLAKKVIKVKTADEFYMVMGTLSKQLATGAIVSSDELVISIYKMAALPLPQFHQLREKYMYDITPFCAALNSASHSAAYSEEEGVDELHDIAKRGGLSDRGYQTMDVHLLKKQYLKLTQRQKQACVLMRITSADGEETMQPAQPTPIAINHLFVGKKLSENKRLNTMARAGKSIRSNSHEESIKASTPCLSDELSTRLDLYATAQQDPRQILRYKFRNTKTADGIQRSQNSTKNIKISDQRSESDKRLETAIKDRLRDTLTCEGHSSDETESGGDSSSSNQTLSRQHSILSTTSTNLSEEVFLPDPSANAKTATGEMSLLQAYSDKSQITTINNNSDYKPYSPFPKPVTGLLTAEKAKVGVKLGLYTPREALSYMSSSQRRQFLNDRRLIHKPVIGSKSSYW